MDEAAEPPTRSVPRRQQRRSCDLCRSRRVRCDSLDKEPCSACRKQQKTCSFTTQWKRPARSKTYAPRVEKSSHGTDISSSPRIDSPYTSTTSQEVLSDPTRVIISETWARNGLSQFFEHGIGASSWDVFNDYEMARIAYIGTPVSSLTHLINLEYSKAPTLHLPYPQIHPDLPWKPEADVGGPRGISESVHDLSTFPAKDIRDEMIDAYFDKINPYFPIIDEADFRKRYADQGKPPPLLLFQSVLLAGAHVCDHPKVVQSQSVVKTVLFRRAKALFDMRHENDRLHLIQAALLFTWYLENDDTASANSYYWAGVACRIAFGLGAHRDLSPRKPTMMPPQDRTVYRRVWWTLFQVEIWTALEHGRPSMIHLSDIDQAKLTIDDFIENGSLNSKLSFDYCSRNIELCYMLLEILRLNQPGDSTGQIALDLSSLNSRLASWMLAISPGHDFGSLQLQLHYHTALLHLHRNFAVDTTSGTQSTEICNSSASAILSIFETMLAQRQIAQCGFTSVISLLAAAVHFARGVKAAFESHSPLLALSVQGQLERLLHAAAELAVYWPNAEAVCKLFQSLLRKFRAWTSEQLDGTTSGVDGSGRGTMSTSMSMSTIDWHDILLYPMASIQGSEMGLYGEDWMNVSPDMGMGMGA